MTWAPKRPSLRMQANRSACVTDIFGFVGAFLTTLSFVPQAWLVLRTGKTEGISLAM